MRRYTIAEIAAALGAAAEGDAGLTIVRAAEPDRAGPDDLALAMSPEYQDKLAIGTAQAALLWAGADWRALGLKAAIRVDRARVALSYLTALLDPGLALAPGIHETAVIDPTAELGPDIRIGAFVVVGPGVQLGPRSRVDSHVSLASGAVVGRDAVLHAGVRIGRNVRIGDRFIAHPNVVIGADGFSFVTDDMSRAEAARASLGQADAGAAQPWRRIHSLGSVTIGDDVEIGAQSCVDAGTIRPTTIGSGTKLDNQVHIAHNCRVGQHCLFAGQVGIAGSTSIGDHVILGGQVGVADNLFVGDFVVAGGGTKILSNAPAGRVLLGYPAVKMDIHVAMYKALRRLPRLAADIARLKKAVSKADPSD